MSLPQEDPGLAPWRELARGLAGSFTARARGLLVVEFALARRDGEAIGALRTRGLANAQVARLEAGGLLAVMERDTPARYRMLTDGAETLAAGPAGRLADALKITCGDRSYEARMSFLRNSAVARSPAGTEAARLRGGLRAGTTRRPSTRKTQARCRSRSCSSTTPRPCDAGPT